VLALRAEGFFRLEFLLLLFQDKRSSPRGNERATIIYLNENISLSDSENVLQFLNSATLLDVYPSMVSLR
jgi:hypothetical protein